MAPKRLHPDDFLCERCGYVLNGLKRSDSCPECGTPIEHSHPEAKPGSPWQQGVRFGVWRNFILFTRHPRTAFDLVQVDGRQARVLEADSIAWAGALLGLFVTVRGIVAAIRTGTPPGHVAMWALAAPAPAFLLSALVLLMLTAIERRGIRVFGALHHRRITPEVAETIVAHACVGWVVAGLLVWAAWPIGELLGWLGRRCAWASWEWTLLAPAILPWLGFFGGLLCFETWVYLGVRRLRFANAAAARAMLSSQR
ncbi:MAG: hypothetical protein Kow0022_01920 [Phycisphaerales bacterium]